MSTKTLKSATSGKAVAQLGEMQQVLRFNLNTFALMHELKSIALSDFDSHFSKDPIGTLGTLAYCAYLNECDLQDKDAELNEKKFKALFFEQSMEQITEIMSVLTSSMIALGKIKAPK